MGAGGEVAFLYRLASHLRKSVAELTELSEEEIMGWAAYLSTAAKKGT
jgi:hypothetical protein